MTTDLRKLRAELDEWSPEIEEQNREIEQLKTEIARKDSDMKELQSQLTMAKMESQVQHKQILKRNDVLAEAKKRIAHLME